MTVSDLRHRIEFMRSIGRETVPVPIEALEALMTRFSTPQSRCLETASDLMEHHGIDNHYVKAVREAAKAAMATSIGKATVKDGKIKPVRKQSASQRAAGHKKAARVVKGLKANRAKAARAK